MVAEDLVLHLRRTCSGNVYEIAGLINMLTKLRDELTVQEHVSILYNLKAANTRRTSQDLATLIDACDLVGKKEAKSKTLSGGQKRKLQLAMMFAEGSSVCCVDEVRVDWIRSLDVRYGISCWQSEAIGPSS